MRVMLFSGGLDSVLQEHFAKPDILLYIDIDGEYSKPEIVALRKLPARYKKRLKIVKFPLGMYERKDAIVPFRNLIFATIAFQYGDEVMMGFNEADTAPDKNMDWVSEVRSLFQRMAVKDFVPKSWRSVQPKFSSPFHHLTKTELLKKYLQDGGDAEFIQKLRTCYDPQSRKGCGRCSPCVSKAVALVNNGLYHPKYFDEPLTVKVILGMLKRREKYRPTSKEINDYKKAATAGVW